MKKKVQIDDDTLALKSREGEFNARVANQPLQEQLFFCLRRNSYLFWILSFVRWAVQQQRGLFWPVAKPEVCGMFLFGLKKSLLVLHNYIGLFRLSPHKSFVTLLWGKQKKSKKLPVRPLVKYMLLFQYPVFANKFQGLKVANTCFLLLLLSLTSLQAQTDVTATIRILPPYPVRLSDYADNPERTLITLRNNTQRTLRLQLMGSITGENGIVIRTAPQFKSPRPVELSPLSIITLNADAIQNLFDVNKLTISGISKSALVQGNGLPEGIYTICIQAMDYQTNEQLSPEEPIGCSNPINITNLEPPILIKPLCGEDTIRGTTPQNLIFTWALPAGAPPSTEYTLTIVEMLDPRKNPNDAFLSATTPVFFEERVSGNAFLFGPAQPTLVPGRKYAYAITAKDPFNKAVFRNGGRSEVCSFVYGTPAMAISGDLLQTFSSSKPGFLDCSCKVSLPSGPVDNSKVEAGSKVKVGNFEMTVLNVSASGNKLNGEGKINLPLLNSSLVPVLVQFSDMQVNASNQMKAGMVQAKLKKDVDFLPTANAPNFNAMPFSSGDVNKLGDYFEKNAEQLVSNMKGAAASVGFELPLGLDKSLGGIETVIAITGMTFTPEQASFDAATVVDLVEAGTKVAFGGKGICMDNSSLCGQGTLYLAEDLNVASTGIMLKGAKASFAAPADSGTYVVFDKEGFSRMRIQAAYAMPTSLFTNKKEPAKPVVATLVANALSWSDWMAAVSFDPFYLAGTTDFAFSLKPGTFAIYDHSSTRNPAGMPTIAEKQNISTPDWNGFFMPQVLVNLPPVIRKINSKDPVTASANNMIIDGMGLTGTVNANNVLDIGTGDMVGWYYSVDNINLAFINNSFSSGGMKGKILLPISGKTFSDPRSQLDYTCTLSQPEGAMKFQLKVQPKEDISAALWVARMNILQTSNIVAEVGSGKTFARATLNGSMDINGNLSPLSVVNLRAMEFEELVVQTEYPYISVKDFKAGLASPQKSVGGFPVSLKDPKLIVSTNQAGISFPIDIELGDIATLPKASCTFDLLGKIRFVNGRPDWGWDKPDIKVSKIAIDGPVGPVNVKGFVEFFDGDNTYGNGVRGGVKAAMLGGLEIEGNALFGRKNYSYWYVDARVKLPPPGITMAPPLPLSAFGFGGGAYYNLRPKPLPSAQELFDDKAPKTNLYEPAAGIVGFKASIILGISDGQLYQAEGGLEATINAKTMAVQVVKIDVNSAMLAPLMEQKKAFIKGKGMMQYDFAQDIFDLVAGMNVEVKAGDAKIIEGYGTFALHINGGSGQWFIKMGDPVSPNGLTFLDFASFKSYYMAGSAGLLPDMMPPPQEVIRQTGYNSQRPVYAGGQQRGIKLAFGASMQFTDKGPADFTFLIFYARIGAGIGFDVALQQFTQGCDGTTNNLPGINGWYANGQLWAWMLGEAGLELDTWFFTGRVAAFKVQAAALLRAGLPNPVWFEGWFGGGYEVLGGMAKGYMRFNVSFNKEKKCIPESNPFEADPLISQINPTGAPISIMANPQVAFNYPVNKDIDFEMLNQNGDPVNRRFKLVITRFDLLNLKTNKVEFGIGTNSRLAIAGENYLATLFTTRALEPQTNYRVVVHVKVQEWLFDRNYYVDYIYNGKLVEQQDDKTTFKTGDCPKDLSDKNVILASYPFNRQRFLLQDEERNGKIILQKALPCLMGGDVYELNAKFTALGSSASSTQEVPITMTPDGRQLNFRIPSLPNDQIIEVRFVQKRKPKPANEMAQKGIVSSFESQNLYKTVRNPAQYINNESTLFTRRTSLAGLSLTEKAVEEITIYTYYFKTSKFNTLTQKVAASAGGATATRQNTFGIMESYQVEFSAAEGFDVFDVNGFSQKLPGDDITHKIRPLIFLTEDDRWYQNYVKNYFYKSYWIAAFGGYGSEISLAYGRDITENGNRLPPVKPLSISNWSAEPALSTSEINAAKPVGMRASTSVRSTQFINK